jgi:serine/threonine protein kinase
MFVSCPRCSQQNYANATQCAYCGAPLAPSQGGPGAGVPAGFAATNAPGFAGGTGPGAGPSVAGAGTTQPQVGQLIDRKYRVERVLGEGGMGIVYVATDVNAEQQVVIKSIRPEFASRADFRERTLQEGKSMAKIDHQNVIRFLSIINHPETSELYIVMQYVEGESLDRTLEKANAVGQKLPITEVIRVFKQILDGVGAAHKEGLIHRDLKPANVLVRAKDGIAKVMDFGIAKTEGATKGPTQVGGIVGSLWYMAPEQIKGSRDLDKRLDIYALGIVLFELTTGHVPFDGETEYEIMTKHMSNAVPSVLTLRPDAPPWIDQIIQRATAKERTERFQSCEEFRAAVDGFDGGIQVPRSHTSYENSIVPEATAPGQGGPPGMPRGTAAMSPMTSQPMQPMTPIPGAPIYAHAPPEKKGGGGGAIIAVVVVLLLGGVGAGLYFGGVIGGGDGGGDKKTQASNDEKKGDKKGDKVEKKDDHVKKDDDKKDDKPPKKDDDKPPKKKDPLDALVGAWEAEGSGRHLTAERQGDEVAFKVDKSSEWEGAFNDGEIRFKLKKGIDDKTFDVVDRYRPPPGTGKSYSKSAFAGCIVQSEKVLNKPLEAVKKTDSIIEVTLATAKVPLIPDAGDPKMISGCQPATATGTITSTLKKTK